MTLTKTALTTTFKQVNKLVGSTAPSSPIIARTVTAIVNAGTPAVTIS